MDGAAVLEQEGALAAAGLAEAEQAPGAIDVTALEFGGFEAKEAGGAAEIVFGEIDEAPASAAAGATGLAGEAERIHGGTILAEGGRVRRETRNVAE